MFFKRKEVTHVQPVVQRTVLEQAIDINDGHLRTMRQREAQLEQRIDELSRDLKDTRTVIQALIAQSSVLFQQEALEGYSSNTDAVDAVFVAMETEFEQAAKEAAE